MHAKPSYQELEQHIRELEARLNAKSVPCEFNQLGKSLAESENRFRLMAENTHSWEYWIGPDAKLNYVSPSCMHHTGYSQSEFMQKESLFIDIVHPKDRADIIKHIAHEHTGPQVESMEFRIIDRLGKTRWISHTCQPVYDNKGIFLGRRASNWEVTDQKIAERERDVLTSHLKSTSNLLNTILDAIPDVIGLQDPHHRIIRYNKAGYNFLGMKPSDVHGKKCHELIGRKTPCDLCATSEVYRTKKVAQVEKYVEELDTWLDVRAYPVFDGNGDILQIIEHLRDISQEKRAEIQLKEAHKRLLTILDSIEAHIYVADLESYEIIFMNQKMIQDFKANLVGKKCYESFCKHPQPCDHCNNKILLDQGQDSDEVLTWQGINPVTQRWYINFDRAIKWVDGRTVKIEIATDITDAKNHEKQRLKMEQQLLQVQKYEAIGTLAGGIAHDFNNLLMGIQGWISLMSADLDPSHPHSDKINAIEEYIRSATDLTRQLLGFARGGKYEVRPIDINALLVESATLFGRTKKEISIHTKFQEPSPVIAADSRQIEQVLLNLYVNSWQAMPEGGELYLQTSIVNIDDAYCKPHAVKPGSYVQISATDTGSGMDKATLQRIFDPFFTTKQKSRGTGLGLASAYGIVKNHDGIITAYSEVGHGTTINLYLPLTDQDAHRELPPKSGFLKGTETVLIVDDEEMIIEVGQALLKTLGYRVLVANGGQKAVDMISKNADHIDLVILDLIMPGIDGGKTFDIIREIQPQLPVLLSSGYSINGKAAEILRRGCNGFIQKPFNISELSLQIRKVLDA